MHAIVRFTAALVAVGVVVAAPGHAVTILDSTWESEGGQDGREWAGFGAHLRLAAEPQFRGVVSFSSDGESWGEASGTWIANYNGRAYILTAGHVYELPADPEEYVVRSPSGEVLEVDKVWIHPKWNDDFDTRSGYDIAIVRLVEPIHDAGPQPVLYTGDDEAGKLITFVGYGERGIGSIGEDEGYLRGTKKAAAQGVVDEWVDLTRQAPEDEDAGNYLGIFLPREDGGIENDMGGSSRPATPLVGLLGAGDSGGSAWMKVGGQWMIVGINSNGSGNAEYGESSWFTRVSPFRRWIERIVPNAVFSDGPGHGPSNMGLADTPSSKGEVDIPYTKGIEKEF
ncbi:MAG: trypsin-like serine protease [Rhodospirillaceae bacterium]